MKTLFVLLLTTFLSFPAQAEDIDVYPAPVLDQNTSYRLPDFNPRWGLDRSLFEETRSYYEAHKKEIPNQRYLMIADFNQHASRKRLYLFDLANGRVESHIVAHGEGSDPRASGYATIFSNTPDSRMSSLGFYLTLGTYVGHFGYSMRLRGLQSTNSNAEARAIVMHPMGGMDEAHGVCSLSWGCPALDPIISQTLLDKVRGGSLFLIGR